MLGKTVDFLEEPLLEEGLQWIVSNLSRKGKKAKERKKKNSTRPWRTTALRCKRQGAKPKIGGNPLLLENLRKACTVLYIIT